MSGYRGMKLGTLHLTEKGERAVGHVPAYLCAVPVTRVFSCVSLETGDHAIVLTGPLALPADRA